MVVMDPKGDQAFVIMDIDQYETLLDLSEHFEEETFIDSNIPSFDEEGIHRENCQSCQDIWDAMPSTGEKEVETWDLSKIGEEEMSEFETAYQQFLEEKTDISKRKEENKEKNYKKSEEKPERVDINLGEEQFYLEPIE